MAPYISDPDFTLYVGDVTDVLATLPDESVHCVITSPPYWGLRDYGTGSWDGGNPDCDHLPEQKPMRKFTNGRGEGSNDAYAGSNLTSWTTRDATVKHGGCPKGCGATRVDQQLGLEPTPEAYVARMVQVFREVRRVLRTDGTLWLNIGDSYGSGTSADRNPTSTEGPAVPASWSNRSQAPRNGLKPKDLVGIPWRLAFALQADGWYLRSDIIWSKPNPMPESVTDRPTKAHEYLFLLTKSPKYFYDQDAIREPFMESTIGRSYTASKARDAAPKNKADALSMQATGWVAPFEKPTPQRETLGDLPPEAPRGPDGRRQTHVEGRGGSSQHRDGERWPGPGRNARSVWEVATEPYPDAHFATYPQALIEPCIKAGCPEHVCQTCGAPRTRIVERVPVPRDLTEHRGRSVHHDGAGRQDGDQTWSGQEHNRWKQENPDRFLGWSDCGHNNYRPGIVLDPFLGSGTTALVARRHGRHTIGIELNQTYAELAAKRLNQLSLLAEGAA